MRNIQIPQNNQNNNNNQNIIRPNSSTPLSGRGGTPLRGRGQVMQLIRRGMPMRGSGMKTVTPNENGMDFQSDV
jgi:hypothetical protein